MQSRQNGLLCLLLVAAVAGCATDFHSDTQKKAVSEFRDCADCPEMVVIAPGSFEMGSPENEVGRQDDEGPRRTVEFARPFAVGKFEITVDDYFAFAVATHQGGTDWKMVGYPGGLITGLNGRYAKHPVKNVYWQDAQRYVACMSARTGKSYRLLTEAEWEYAARSGGTPPSAFEPSDTWEELPADPYRDSLPVGTHAPNGFGIYDMTGNAREWVEDCYLPSYKLAPTDGSAVEGKCKKRVVRGGYAYGYDGNRNFIAQEFMRIANRDWDMAVKKKVEPEPAFVSPATCPSDQFRPQSFIVAQAMRRGNYLNAGTAALALVDRERSSGLNLLANVNPTFTWVRLAQRIPVRIDFDSVPDGVKLATGQTATVVVQELGRK